MKSKTAIFLLLFCNLLLAQTSSKTYKITGTLSDEVSGKGLISATVSVLQRSDGKILTGGTTDDRGYFTVDNISEPLVKVKFSMVGYQNITIDSVDVSETSRLGLIKMTPATMVMPEMVIKSLKPMIEVHADRQVLNIDRLPGSSGSLTDALKNSGVVQVDPQSKKITVRGQDVKIQMDGREYDMPPEMLTQLPASIIEQAEVITSPGAKESAEGGTYILNLVSKKNTVDNYSGSFNIHTSSSKWYYGGYSLNYKLNKMNFFSQASAGYFEYTNSSIDERYTYDSKSNYYQSSTGDSRNFSPNGYFKLGMDYNFNDYNSMTLTGSYNTFRYKSDYFSDYMVRNNQLLPEYNYHKGSANSNQYNTITFSGFYKKKFATKGKELTSDLMYTIIDNPADSKLDIQYSNRPGQPQQQQSKTGVNAQTFIYKADYVMPYEGGRFETGYSFTYRNRENDYDVLDYSYITSGWRDSMQLSNTFSYKERIHALYATASYKLGRFDIKGGLRTENLITDGNQLTTGVAFSENFLNFFPNINIAYKFTDVYQLSFNAFRRVRYPQIYYLNPFRQYAGPNTYSAGNPKIEPGYINSYALNFSQYINAFYVYSTGMITRATSTENDSVMVSSYFNLASNKTFGVDLTLPYYNTPDMWFHLPEFVSMMNIQFHYTHIEQTGQFINENLAMKDDSWSLNANVNLKLWLGIEADAYFYYSPSTSNKLRKQNDQKYLYLSLSKSFMNNKLRFDVSCDGVLDDSKYETESFGSNYYTKGKYVFSGSRSISVGIRYMFNDFKERRDRSIDDGRDNGGGGGGRGSM